MAWHISPAGARAARDLALVAMIVWLTAGPAAQGLAEVARRSAGQDATARGRLYTNADVEPAQPVQPVATPTAAEPAAAERKDRAASRTRRLPPSPLPRRRGSPKRRRPCRSGVRCTRASSGKS